MSFFSKLFSSFKKTSASTQETKFPGVVVGRIVSVDPHPNADRLRVAMVDTGEKLQIVCGAPNIAAGQLVPVATVGTTLPNGATITKATIRGVESSGMLCAEDELGLGSDHSGIKVLTHGIVGQPIDPSLN